VPQRPPEARSYSASIHRNTRSLAEEQAPGLTLGDGPEQPRAHHRRGGERYDERYEDRGRESHGELAEQAPDDAAHEKDRMNTAIREILIETTVKLTSRAPLSAA